MRILRIILIVLLVVLVAGLAAFTLWAYTPLGPMPEALAAMQGSAGVTVSESPWLTFAPANEEPVAGFIFYPGGRVDHRSYAPAALALAEQGYLAVIVPMPFNLAVFGSNRADDVIAAHPGIDHWVVGGHSLGGAMAAAYAYSHPGGPDGIALWAAYPAGNNSLADQTLAVASVSGTNDGLSTPEKIDASRPLLPPDTVFTPIEGGNHAQFGYYGPQGGDGEATITREDQQAQVVKATADLLQSLGK